MTTISRARENPAGVDRPLLVLSCVRCSAVVAMGAQLDVGQLVAAMKGGSDPLLRAAVPLAGKLLGHLDGRSVSEALALVCPRCASAPTTAPSCATCGDRRLVPAAGDLAAQLRPCPDCTRGSRG